ncbi:ankyrin repeat domain-containing protein [Trichloromonas sp.]|uniref:ankyrin repeat domain-containing protein n=1 Tax=Trichloromonas sp. TaxID=3069249 RepID=UPI002A43618D|nr:ankyrin repeat domain-containing protein [Trichloromonas sp.]
MKNIKTYNNFIMEGIFDFLDSKYKDLSPNELLMRSAVNGYKRGVVIALKRGADIHHRDDYALRWSVNKGYYDIVKILLDNGANVNVSNNQPIRVADMYGHTDILELLKKYEK